METKNNSRRIETPSRNEFFWATWTVMAAFGTYFCMYGFRKPFTAAAFEGAEAFDIHFKTIAISVQVLGYMISKFVGIKVISEMPPQRRALSILGLIAVAEIGLVLFGLMPRPWNVIGLFLNGLSLGMVFGLVLSFLEGRRLTEALAAGLCASFILADGVTKSVGSWLLQQGVPEDWMPSAAGLVFLLPLCLGVTMLSQIPSPNKADIQARSARTTMGSKERRAFFARYASGLSLLVFMYLMLTIVRSVRADFAPELWKSLGATAAPSTFSRSELWVTVGILVLNGGVVFIRNNRAAFGLSLATCLLGFAITVAALWGQHAGLLGAFPFMVMIGLGLYLPYVAMHTTVFERLLAMTQEHANLGFLMYIADAFGYLGYVAVMFSRSFWPVGDNHLQFFIALCIVSTVASTLCLLGSWRYFTAQTESVCPIPTTTEGIV